MSSYFERRQRIAQGIEAPEPKKGGVKKKESEKSSGIITLDQWFADRHREMTGKCLHCQGKTEKGQLSFKCSIAHLLPKRLFESIATHPLNWLELCHYGNSCHQNFDNHILEWTQLNCFDLAVERFIIIYPSIAKAERKYIPDALLQYLDAA